MSFKSNFLADVSRKVDCVHETVCRDSTRVYVLVSVGGVNTYIRVCAREDLLCGCMHSPIFMCVSFQVGFTESTNYTGTSGAPEKV